MLLVLAVEDDLAVVAVGRQIAVFVVAEVLIRRDKPVRRLIDQRSCGRLDRARTLLQCPFASKMTESSTIEILSHIEFVNPTERDRKANTRQRLPNRRR